MSAMLVPEEIKEVIDRTQSKRIAIQAANEDINHHYVAVYGSLKQGFGNHSLLRNCPMVTYGKTEPVYTMISLGYFPGVLKVGNTSIHVEVYQVDDTVFHRLDCLEGHPTFYKREEILLPQRTNSTNIKDNTPVWIYIYQGSVRDSDKVIKSGFWEEVNNRRSS